ncbi:MAG TPA: hypothetical protein VLB44_12195, partial [Kofleriaceae bacterium]|nr:hypothetical protein [Kofleriaceae bacterium]
RGEAGRQSDIYSLGVVLWEMIVGKRLHQNVHGEAQLIAEIMSGRNATITEALEAERSWIGSYRWSQLEALDPIIRKALDVNARRRWATAADMEEALAAAVPVAPAADVSAWLKAVGKDFLDDRDRMIAEEEASWRRAGSTFSIPSLSEHDIVEIPTSTASEPEGTPARAVIWRRGTTAIIAVLAALLVTSIAFLLRDLERSTPAPAPTTASAPPLPVVPAPAAAPEKPLTQPVRDVMVRDVMIDKTADEEHEDAESKIRIEKPEETVPDKPIVKVRSVAQAPSRSRAVRSPPPRPAPPVRTAAPSPPPKPAVMLDCTTPFYFEGHKKVFKPGCL